MDKVLRLDSQQLVIQITWDNLKLKINDFTTVGVEEVVVVESIFSHPIPSFRYICLFTERSYNVSGYSCRGVHIVLTEVGRKQRRDAEKQCEQPWQMAGNQRFLPQWRNWGTSLTAWTRGNTSVCCWWFNCSPVSLWDNLALHTVPVWHKGLFVCQARENKDTRIRFVPS